MANDIQTEARSSEAAVAPRDPLYERARERAEMLQGLYIHMMVFAVVNAGLLVTNWLTRGETGPWWVVWPVLVWGIGLAIHVLVVITPVFSPGWVDRRAETMTRNER